MLAELKLTASMFKAGKLLRNSQSEANTVEAIEVGVAAIERFAIAKPIAAANAADAYLKSFPEMDQLSQDPKLWIEAKTSDDENLRAMVSLLERCQFIRDYPTP